MWAFDPETENLETPSSEGVQEERGFQEATFSEQECSLISPLLEARLKKSWSVEDMARQLCLRPAMIEALEEERWEVLSHEPAYVLGFIQAYGKLVGRNMGDVIGRFKHFQSQAREESRASPLEAISPETKVLTPHKPTPFLFWVSCLSSLALIACLTPLLKPFKPFKITSFVHEKESMRSPRNTLPWGDKNQEKGRSKQDKRDKGLKQDQNSQDETQQTLTFPLAVAKKIPYKWWEKSLS